MKITKRELRELVKENIEKKRKVYKLEDRYRKVWEG